MDDAERSRRIRQKIESEIELANDIKEEIRTEVLRLLIEEKGYPETEIERAPQFDIPTATGSESVSIDFIISLDGRRLIAIKCCPTALESRERHILAFCRAADAYVIPMAVVTNSDVARIMETETGRVTGDSFSMVPTRSQALEMFSGIPQTACPADRLKMERRILLAFEVIQCRIVDDRNEIDLTEGEGGCDACASRRKDSAKHQ